jgi:hypothetical protein
LALPDDALDRWLDDFLERALPLWPAQELAAHVPVESWILEPEGSSGAEPGLQSMECQWRIRDWGERQLELRWGMSSLDGIVAVRWVALDLDGEEEQWRSDPG